MEPDKWAFVDVDNTLWDFDKELRRRMVDELGLSVPSEWTTWTEPEDVMGSSKAAHDLFNEMHYEQHHHEPFDASKMMLKDLQRLGYRILIATNRIPETEPMLVNRLEDWELPFDEIFCNLGKNRLLVERKIDLVIDDSPYILEEAVNNNIKAMTLRYKYNKNIPDVKKFKNMQEMHEFLVREAIMSI